MPNELIYRDVTGKTVTVDVDSASSALGNVTAAEVTGRYRATMPTAPAGVYWLRWNNTTDSTTHREQIYWDGTDVVSPPQLTAQQVRDASAIDHTDGTAGSDTFFKVLQGLVLRR